MYYFTGQRDFEIVIEDLAIERLSWIIQSQCNYKGFYKKKKRRQERKKGDVTIEAEFRVMWGHEPRNVDSLAHILLEKARKQDSLLKLPEGPVAKDLASPFLTSHS